MSPNTMKLRAVRATLAAAVSQVDAMLAEEASYEKTVAVPGSAECKHPESSRLSAARMGAPEAFVCGLCGKEGNVGGRT